MCVVWVHVCVWRGVWAHRFVFSLGGTQMPETGAEGDSCTSVGASEQEACSPQGPALLSTGSEAPVNTHDRLSVGNSPRGVLLVQNVCDESL